MTTLPYHVLPYPTLPCPVIPYPTHPTYPYARPRLQAGGACAGYVASGPLVLLVQVLEGLGPQPSARQVQALFALSGVGTVAGAALTSA